MQRGDKTQETRHKTNRLISPGREAVKRTDNYLRYAPHKGDTFPSICLAYSNAYAYLHIKLLTFA